MRQEVLVRLFRAAVAVVVGAVVPPQAVRQAVQHHLGRQAGAAEAEVLAQLFIAAAQAARLVTLQAVLVAQRAEL